MKEFIFENWQYLLCGLFFVVEVVLILIKKPFKLDTKKEEILRVLPLFIEIAERLFSVSGSGSEKLSFVIESIKNLLKLDSSYDGFINASIEAILSTPTKKGDK